VPNFGSELDGSVSGASPVKLGFSPLDSAAANDVVAGPGPSTGRSDVAESHEGDIDTGFLQPFINENRIDARAQVLYAKPGPAPGASISSVSLDLLHIFLETYFDSCYAWCPVLDRAKILEELKSSPLLSNALAALGSNLKPPMLPHEGPASYYDRARRLFYEDEEPNTLTCLRGILLFYWWAPRATSLVHRHSSWWWTSVVIRHGQQMNLHRAQPSSQNSRALVGLQRRVWWTAFARERLTALCQSKPAIINPNDCSVPELTLDDFPPDMQQSPKAQVFIYYVRLCTNLGHIAQHLSQPDQSPTGTATSPNYLSLRRPAHNLVTWIRSLPQNLSLRISDEYTSFYDRDIWQLHLPYLTAVIVLNLKRAGSPGSLPEAGPPAIFAASCTARIFKDILARGDTRFLMAITSWHCGAAALALFSARKQASLQQATKADIEIIRLMSEHLGRMWGSASVVHQGIERLNAAAEQEERAGTLSQEMANGASFSAFDLNGMTTDGSPDNFCAPEGQPDWMEYFPFATSRTSGTVRKLLESKEQSDAYFVEANLLSNYLSSDINDYMFDNYDGADFITGAF
jgi:hypothetical protein